MIENAIKRIDSITNELGELRKMLVEINFNQVAACAVNETLNKLDNVDSPFPWETTSTPTPVVEKTEVRKLDYKKVNKTFSDCLDVLGKNKDNNCDEVKDAISTIKKMIDENMLSENQVKAGKQFIENRQRHPKGTKMNFCKQNVEEPKAEVNQELNELYKKWTTSYKDLYARFGKHENVTATEAESYLKLVDEMREATKNIDFKYKTYLMSMDSVYSDSLQVLNTPF